MPSNQRGGSVDPAELAGLNDVLEGRPLVIGMNGGEIIRLTACFCVIVTGNSRGVVMCLGNIKVLRCRTSRPWIAIDLLLSYPEKAVEEAIVTKHHRTSKANC
jgi:cobaltochelatase CobS